MLNMSGAELIIIAVAAIVLLGPEDLPKVARAIDKTFKQIRQAADDSSNPIERAVLFTLIALAAIVSALAVAAALSR